MFTYYWEGILNYFDFRVTNGLMEGLTSVIQSLKRSVREYRNTDNFIAMIYLRYGTIKFDLPARYSDEASHWNLTRVII